MSNDMRPDVSELKKHAPCTKKKEPPARLPHDKHAGENTLAFPGDVLSTISIYQK